MYDENMESDDDDENNDNDEKSEENWVFLLRVLLISAASFHL